MDTHWPTEFLQSWFTDSTSFFYIAAKCVRLSVCIFQCASLEWVYYAVYVCVKATVGEKAVIVCAHVAWRVIRKTEEGKVKKT